MFYERHCIHSSVCPQRPDSHCRINIIHYWRNIQFPNAIVLRPQWSQQNYSLTRQQRNSNPNAHSFSCSASSLKTISTHGNSIDPLLLCQILGHPMPPFNLLMDSRGQLYTPRALESRFLSFNSLCSHPIRLWAGEASERALNASIIYLVISLITKLSHPLPSFPQLLLWYYVVLLQLENPCQGHCSLLHVH